MRRRVILLVTLAMLGTMLASSSAVAAPPGGSGGQISVLFPPPTTAYPANTAFHVSHGWGFDRSAERPAGRYLFLLEIDGAPQGRGRMVRTHDGTSQTALWLYDFPAGMTGTHTFEGFWYGPCDQVTGGPCPKPKELTLAHTGVTEVTFTP